MLPYVDVHRARGTRAQPYLSLTQVQLDPVSRNPWRLRLNLLPNEPVTLRSGTQRGDPGMRWIQHHCCLVIRWLQG